ncbi:uncharacterized protein LOC122378538 [Amphibalanus amphitrite]|uniref:uncharacterized protein LOC122378538 n=1 Tax=Amphibalanus amphitrite TaxID=1232801 RepID=UPI001C900A65|nr:uncharacterized protein LOC122378538 [Amphibalanus amphitrite]XP_043215640.1 uncharacterized protein LOC122378538 [Amphibalanus amphitrite]XP_043215641.1 uncharacterized protein LOC122378538 [Amphibalanus amphitrite]XP_043215642.1 uncharacterized protein LOC122378538 [Amphibalanus amphitrite]XP_043215643.1 uncharacterized protein LOC122378538 [Amphibalanus amphitrite]
MSKLFLNTTISHLCSSILSSFKPLGPFSHAAASLHVHSCPVLHHRLSANIFPAPRIQSLAPPSVTRSLQTARSGSSRREERWRRRDRIPSEFRLVYVAPNERWMRAAALAVASPLLVAVPAAALRPASVLLAAEWQVLLGGGLYGLLAAAVLLLTWRYPFRMYHSAARRQFRAVLTGPLLLNSRQLSLPEGSVSRVRSVSNMMPWMDSLYKSQQGKLVLLDTGFQSAEMFNRLLGHHVDEDGDSGGSA